MGSSESTSAISGLMRAPEPEIPVARRLPSASKRPLSIYVTRKGQPGFFPRTSSSRHLQETAGRPPHPNPRVISGESMPPGGPTKRSRIASVEELYQALTTHPHTREIVAGRVAALQAGAPQTPRKARAPRSYLQNDAVVLNVYERGEILRKPEVYFTGVANCDKPDVRINDFKHNFGFDDADKNYRAFKGDHIDYRYEIMGRLGKGSFGDVLRCRDHSARPGPVVAIKVIKNDLAWSLQAVYEIKILKHLNEYRGLARTSDQTLPVVEASPSAPQLPPILTYLDHFHFRGHMCIVTELLCANLYQAIEASHFRGFDPLVVRLWARELLEGLAFLHLRGIIHCDLKPENVMLVAPNSFRIKLIDFGLASFSTEVSYTYIQSRFYRAPEVVMGARYSTKIDIWSLGCMLAETVSGEPLFPGSDETGQLGCITDVLGPPHRSTVARLRCELREKGPITNLKEPSTPSLSQLPLYVLFNEQGRLDMDKLNRKAGKRQPTTLEMKVRPGPGEEEFVDFLLKCLVWDPDTRWNADRLLHHPFLDSKNSPLFSLTGPLV